MANREGGEKECNSGYILKIEPKGFPDRLDMRYKRKRGCKYDFIHFGFSNWKKRAVSD